MKLLALTLCTLAVCGTLYATLTSTQQLSSTQLFLSSSDATDKDIHLAFVSFLAKYGRSYASKEHMTTRYEVFKQNFKSMQAHDRARTGYSVGVNQFSDLTEEEFLQIYGKGLLESQSKAHRLRDS
jgi:membrane protein insertase Oxa1/YidC/SpoIIIJ